MQKTKWDIQIPTKMEINEIDQRLGDFNQAMLNFAGEQEKPIAYIIKNKDEIIAGISASIDWGFILHVDLLFVEEEYRHQGIGSLLLAKVENEARNSGVGLAQTDTFDFQAKDFYLRHDYEIFGLINNSPRPGHKCYYLKKELNHYLASN